MLEKKEVQDIVNKTKAKPTIAIQKKKDKNNNIVYKIIT